jgi:hypothetical protein
MLIPLRSIRTSQAGRWNKKQIHPQVGHLENINKIIKGINI